MAYLLGGGGHSIDISQKYTLIRNDDTEEFKLTADVTCIVYKTVQTIF